MNLGMAWGQGYYNGPAGNYKTWTLDWTGLDWTLDWTGLWTGLDSGLDWTQLWIHKEDAETVFYSVLQCSKHYQVYVAILIHKMYQVCGW